MEKQKKEIYNTKIINLSSFGQVDESSFKKVRISFSNEREILHVNTFNETKNRLRQITKQL